MREVTKRPKAPYFFLIGKKKQAEAKPRSSEGSGGRFSRVLFKITPAAFGADADCQTTMKPHPPLHYTRAFTCVRLHYQSLQQAEIGNPQTRPGPRVDATTTPLSSPPLQAAALSNERCDRRSSRLVSKRKQPPKNWCESLRVTSRGDFFPLLCSNGDDHESERISTSTRQQEYSVV